VSKIIEREDQSAGQMKTNIVHLAAYVLELSSPKRFWELIKKRCKTRCQVSYEVNTITQSAKHGSGVSVKHIKFPRLLTVVGFLNRLKSNVLKWMRLLYTYASQTTDPIGNTLGTAIGKLLGTPLTMSNTHKQNKNTIKKKSK
jgi:hypothetical protein